MHNRKHAERDMNQKNSQRNHNNSRGDQRNRYQGQEDSLFPEQNYYRPGKKDQESTRSSNPSYGGDQNQYGQYGYGQEFSPGMSGGYNSDRTVNRDSDYPSYQGNNYNRNDYSSQGNSRRDTSFGGGNYIGQGSDYRGSSIGGSSYQQGNQYQGSSASGAYPQGLGSHGTAISGSFGQDNGYEGTSTWRGQSSDDKDSSYSWGQKHPSSGRGDNTFHSTQSFYGKGPKGYKRSDERIREDVSEALYHDHSIDASEIDIKVESGEVTLSGTVSSRQMKRLAEDCTEKVSGVSDVRNEIKVQSGSSSDMPADRATTDKSKKLTNSASNSSNKIM